MGLWIRAARACLTALAVVVAPAWAADPRVALVIGNAAYPAAAWTFWYEPGWGYSVRLRTEFRDRGAPDIVVRDMVARARKE